jgi:hypothetical protein
LPVVYLKAGRGKRGSGSVLPLLPGMRKEKGFQGIPTRKIVRYFQLKVNPVCELI